MQGKVSGITNFDALIDLGAGETGLIRIGEVSNGYVKDIHDVLSVGDEVTAKVISVDDGGEIGLSTRKVQEQPTKSGEESRPKKYQQKDLRNNRNCSTQKKSFSRSQPSAQEEDFDLLVNSFLRGSDGRLSSLKRNTEGGCGGRGGHRS